ncbi:enhancer of split M1 protein [Wyeomyia smithii]|uniref:enhancer of split M1 protein n=1 Tax=Wyeomyia smithii TaxID=174621 RepID=UPI002468227E|nr:enhancer of split M1 protein [Wyeomyia smithii]
MNEFKFWITLCMAFCIALLVNGADNQCPKPCPHIMDPVCASNGEQFRTFSNRCLLQAHNDCEQEDGQTPFQETDSDDCPDEHWA